MFGLGETIDKRPLHTNVLLPSTKPWIFDCASYYKAVRATWVGWPVQGNCTSRQYLVHFQLSKEQYRGNWEVANSLVRL